MEAEKKFLLSSSCRVSFVFCFPFSNIMLARAGNGGGVFAGMLQQALCSHTSILVRTISSARHILKKGVLESTAGKQINQCKKQCYYYTWSLVVRTC